MLGLPVKNNKRFSNFFPTTQKKRIGLPTDKTSVPLAISRVFSAEGNSATTTLTMQEKDISRCKTYH
jgi:hypothetical protein